MYTVLFSILFLFTGVIGGWLACERYQIIMKLNEHEYDDIFESNPHPEIYTANGKIDRGEYIAINFDLGYDPDEWDSEDLKEG